MTAIVGNHQRETFVKIKIKLVNCKNTSKMTSEIIELSKLCRNFLKDNIL